MNTNRNEIVLEMDTLIETFRQLDEPKLGLMVSDWRAEYMLMAAGLDYFEASDEKTRVEAMSLGVLIHEMEDRIDQLEAELTPVEDDVIILGCDDVPVDYELEEATEDDYEDFLVVLSSRLGGC